MKNRNNKRCTVSGCNRDNGTTVTMSACAPCVAWPPSPSLGLAPLGFRRWQGTTSPLRLHTCMDKQTKSKHFRGDSRADASRRPRTVIHTKRAASRQRSAEPNRCSAAPAACFDPVRDLMICVGWLQLFRAIVSDGIPSRRGPFPHET